MFKIGHKVERISSHFKGMKVGDKDIIIDITGERRDTFTLKKFGNGHANYSFKLIGERNEI